MSNFFSPPSSWSSKGYQGRRQIPTLGGCFVVAAQPFQWNGGSLSHLLKVKWETCKCISSCVSATKVVSRRDSGHAIGAGFESAIIHSVGKSLKNSHMKVHIEFAKLQIMRLILIVFQIL